MTYSALVIPSSYSSTRVGNMKYEYSNKTLAKATILKIVASSSVANHAKHGPVVR